MISILDVLMHRHILTNTVMLVYWYAGILVQIIGYLVTGSLYLFLLGMLNTQIH